MGLPINVNNNVVDQRQVDDMDVLDHVYVNTQSIIRLHIVTALKLGYIPLVRNLRQAERYHVDNKGQYDDNHTAYDIVMNLMCEVQQMAEDSVVLSSKLQLFADNHSPY
jgi:hypothetical protein